MLTFNRSEDITEEMIKVLRKHIEGITPAVGFKEIFNEWPAGNFTMDYPSLTILTAANPEYRANMNKPIVLIDNFDIDTKQADILREVGFWEFDLQLDLWCKSKNQRTEFLRKLEEILDPNLTSKGKAGLHITMPDYYNDICSYTYQGYSYEDGEISAQRREWRASLRVKADARSLRDNVEFIMEQTVIDLELKNTNEALNP